MNKQLIINADGFGFTSGVNKGIYESIVNGIVTSISCVVNFPFIKDVSKFRKEFEERSISIGIHFNLSVGKPISPIKKVPSLIDGNTGEFWGDKFAQKCLCGEIKIKDIEEELESQIRVLLDLGIKPSHWDGHQNKHLYPKFFWAATNIAKKYSILAMRTHKRYIFLLTPKNRRLRILDYYINNPKRFISHSYCKALMKFASYYGFKMADRLITPAYADKGKKYLLDTWLALIKYLPKGINEIYCHPGYCDETLVKYAKYIYEREEEVKVLTSRELMDAIIEDDIKLISFKDI